MKSNQIRQQFLSFYAARGHQILSSVPLVAKPPNLMMRSNLWTLPFHPLSLGQRYSPEHPSTILQKHISPNVSVLTQRHPTFFEILGNWGNYSKKQALIWAWELCTEVYHLSPSQLVVSVDPRDSETIAIWRDQIGLPESRIIHTRFNFWRTHPYGHCGFSTRIHYDCYPERGYEKVESEEDIHFQAKSREYYDREDTLPYLLPEEALRFLNVYQLVFMDAEYPSYQNIRTSLKTYYIEAGMNVERLATILQQVSSFYETDLMFPLIQTVAQVAGVDYPHSDHLAKVSMKVIADQVRAAIHLSADYSSKPIQRWPQPIHQQIQIWLMRLVLHAQLLEIPQSFIEGLISTMISLEESVYPHLRQQQSEITTYLKQQESSCWTLLRPALEKGVVTGSLLDQFFRTYNCSVKVINRWAMSYVLTLDWDGYNALLGPEID